MFVIEEYGTVYTEAHTTDLLASAIIEAKACAEYGITTVITELDSGKHVKTIHGNTMVRV